VKKNGPTSVSEFVCVCARDVQKRINRLICHLEEQTRVGPRNIVFDADSGLLTGNGHFWQGHVNYMDCAKVWAAMRPFSKLLWTLVSLVSACRFGLEVPGG